MDAILPYLIPAMAAVLVAAITALAARAGRSHDALVTLLREERDVERRTVADLRSQIAGLERIVAEQRPTRKSVRR